MTTESTTASADGARILEILEQVMDPEVPVLSVVELGIVRGARLTESGEAEVTITPTYSGCPAMHVIEEDIVRALRQGGYGRVSVKTTYSPAWTTDWMSDEAREKLRAYGIAPPDRSAPDEPLIPLMRAVRLVRCPYCGSDRTELRSEFGSTACKSILYCRACTQPFEQFKAI